MRHLARRFAAVAATLAVAALPFTARAATTFTTTSITTDNFTANGNVSFNDASADTITIGQNGGTPDTVQIAGDVSLTDANWSVSAAGAAAFGSVNGLTLVANVDGFQVGGGSTASRSLTLTGGNLTLTASGATALTLPSSGTLATLAGSETLSNKAIAAPRVTSGIFDNNGNEIVLFPLTASAVNEFSMSNATTGGNPVFEVTGSDANIGLTLQTKGAGDFDFQTTTATTDVFRLRPAAGAARNTGTLTSADLTATRTWTLPDSTGNVVLDTATQTLTNKTLTTPRIGTGVLDANGNKIIGLNPVGAAVNEITLTNAITSAQPIISTSGTDTNVGMRLQTKGNGTFILQNSVPSADQLVISLGSGGASSFAGTLSLADLTATRAWALPDADGTFVLESATQTLTNKTLTLPRISGIKDTNGADILAFNATASAVNGFQMFNAGTGVDPSLLVIGSDAAIDMRLQAKGTGTIMMLNSSTGADMFAFQPAAGAATFLGTVTTADLTANRTWTLPNAGGTIALTTDITGAAGFTDGGTDVTLVTSTDSVGIGSSPSGKLHVTGTTNTSPVVVVQAAASQTGNLQEWKDAAGTAILARLTNVGDLRIRGNGGTAVVETDTTATVNLFNGVPTTVNFAGAATALNIGATSGTTTVGNALTVNRGATILTPATTTKSLVVRRILNQTSVLQEWQNESSAALAFLEQDGSFTTTAGLTANGLVSLGDATGDRVNVAGELRVGLINADPSGTNGLMYYNTASNKFRCHENSTWKDCDTAAGASVSGTPLSGHAAFFTSASTLSSDASFFWDNTNKRLGIGTNSPSSTLTAVSSTAITANPVTTLQLDAMTSGTPVAGFGTSILLRAEDTAGTADVLAAIEAAYTDATDTSEDTEIRFTTRSAGGLLTNALTIGNTGSLSVAGSTTLGDAGADSLTLNGGTMSIPNGLNVDANTLMISSSLDRVAVGTNNPFSKLHVSADGGAVNGAFDISDSVVFSRSGNILGTSMIVAGTGSSFYPILRGIRSNGTLAAPTVAQAGDRVFGVQGLIYDGVDVESTAEIRFLASGAVASDVAPQQISFLTSTTTGGNLVERMRVNADGVVEVFTSLKVGNSGSAMTQHRSVLATLDLPTTSSGSCSTLQADASGIGLNVAVGDMVTIVPAFDDTAWDFGNLTIFVEVAGQLKLTYCNHNASAIDPASGQYRISHWKY